ncbi:MAG: hypothetical protein K6T66_08250 [Peptococcaceae bacterium]|nr:hypothetical protein [Peptococcaceae bacterium]
MDWWLKLDGILIGLYRITGWPVPDYFIGTFLLAMITVVIGDFTTSLVFRANRGYYTRLNARLAELHELSMTALRLKEKSEYKAVNREANDTFGLLFFSMFGLSAAYLWPVFFALAWMQTRFAGISFPLFIKGWTTGYFFTFLVCYLIARVIFAGLKPHLPYFKHAAALAAADKNPAAGEKTG